MRSRLISLASNILIFLSLILAVEWWQGTSMRQGTWPEGAKVLPSLDGSSLSTPSGSGVTLVYIFAPWCGVCRATAGNLNQIKLWGFNVVGLALAWEQKGEVQEFISSTGLSIPVALGDEDISRELSVGAFPSYFILSPTGRIVKAWSGYSTTAGLLLKIWAYGLTSPS